MRQEFLDAAVHVGGQPRQHVLEVDPRIVPVELGRLRQAHDDGSALAGEFATGEEPCAAPHRPAAHEVLDMVVVCALPRHG